MIDEDLYKIATDELNSDARKPDVWARACALANDDHDEARFLYTNLRVEDMLSDTDRKHTLPSGDPGQNSRQAHPDPTDTLELEQPELKDADPMQSLELSLDDDLPSPVASTRSGIDTKHSPLPTGELDGFDIGNLDAATSASGSEIVSDKVVEFDDETMAELSALSLENASDNNALSGITGEAINDQIVNPDPVVDHLPARSVTPNNNDIVSDVYDSSAAQSRPQILSPEDQRKAELSREFERQAQSMHDDEHEALEESDSFRSVEEHDRTAEVTDADAAYASRALEAPNKTATSAKPAVRSDYAEPSNMLDDDNTWEFNSELDTGAGRSFMILSRQDAIKAIKFGVSWPALFFTFPWLISKALFGTALIYGCLWIVSLGGLFFSANSWLNAGADASTNIKLWTGAFALLAIIGLLYIPFRYGNRWVADKLQNRGFEYQALVSASNKLDAVARLLRFNQQNLG